MKKRLMSALGVALLGVIMLGVSGCGADNETAAEQAAKNSAPPKLPEGAKDQPQAVVSDYSQYAAQRKANTYVGTKLDTAKTGKPASK